MVEWIRIQQNNTQYCVSYRKWIANMTAAFVSGNGPLAKTPTGLKAVKRTLQELLCIATR
jgi:hypothetical protein